MDFLLTADDIMIVITHMKRKVEDLTKKEIITTLDALYTAASAVKGRNAVKLFLRDLLTQSERLMLGRRIIIARMLLFGIEHEEIMRRLRVGKGTVRRVHHWLQDKFPGFENAIAEMEKEYGERQQKRTSNLTPYSAQWVRRKYPLMFWFIPLQTKKRKNSDLYPL